MINKDKIIREANKVFDLIVFDKKHNPLLLSAKDIEIIKDKVNIILKKAYLKSISKNINWIK